MARILVADDDRDVVDTLSVVLKFHGFEVYSARDGRAALTLVRDAQPDAVILEVLLPGLDGFDVLRRMRAERMDAPTLFLSSQDSLHDKLTGLTLGADDYMTKPFSPEELIARLRVTLRRGKTVTRVDRSARMTFADIELDQESQEAWKAGKPVPLSPTEFRLLRCFVNNAGKVLRKPEILELVWGQPVGRDVTTVETYISRLRRKIETRDEPLLHTLRGVGYMLREPY